MGPVRVTFGCLWLLVWMGGCGGDDGAVAAGDAGDGVGALDSDGDGYSDQEEKVNGELFDSDGDGTPDWMDGDSHPMVLDSVCPEGNANASTGDARVILLLDGSTSMEDGLGGRGGSSRWEAMRSALMDDDGVVTTLQGVVEFGMALYSGSLGSFGGNGPDGCPELAVTQPARNNGDAIGMALPGSQPGGSTPTHLALEYILDPANGLFASDQPDQRAQSQVLIIATDGQPNNLCRGGMDIQDAQAAADVVSAVQQATNLGIRTYVISLAGGDGGLMQHLAEVAEAGNTGEAPFVPQDRGELINTLQAIIGGAIGCRILLDGAIEDGLECAGTVTLSSRAQPLSCGTDYEVSDDRRSIELVGAACDEFMANPVSLVRADFPCGAFTADNPQ